jgi:hypothetical protein
MRKYTKENSEFSESFFRCDYCKINKGYIYSTKVKDGYLYTCSEECLNILIFVLLDRRW